MKKIERLGMGFGTESQANRLQEPALGAGELGHAGDGSSAATPAGNWVKEVEPRFARLGFPVAGGRQPARGVR